MGETIVIPIISGTNVKTKVEYIVGILTGKIDIDGLTISLSKMGLIRDIFQNIVWLGE